MNDAHNPPKTPTDAWLENFLHGTSNGALVFGMGNALFCSVLLESRPWGITELSFVVSSAGGQDLLQELAEL